MGEFLCQFHYIGKLKQEFVLLFPSSYTIQEFTVLALKLIKGILDLLSTNEEMFLGPNTD